MSKHFLQFARHRVWVVTGAGSGIGLEMLRYLLSHGAVVWALDLDQEALNRLAAEAAREGSDVFTRLVDVTDVKAVERVVAEIVATSRRIDVWVNNAGIQKVGTFATQDPELYNLVMRVNYESVVNLTRMILQRMENQGDGIILNMASVAGHIPAPFMTSYVASKHAVIGFTRALRAELELLKSPVRCVVASPGFVDTGIIAKGHQSGFPEWLSWLLASPRDCAHEILDALARGRNEIEPTLNGRAMTTAFKFLPQFTVKSSRLLLTRGIRDFVLNRYHVPNN